MLVSIDGFPATRHSIVRRMQADEPEVRAWAFDAFAVSYWRPVSRYIRFKWHTDMDGAADLTQEFFARTLENEALGRFDPTRARFRTYVRLLVDGFVSNARKAEARLKRGGGQETVPLEQSSPDGRFLSYEPQVIDDLDEIFYREWVRGLFERAVADLEAESVMKSLEVPFEVFTRYDLAESRGEARPTYAQIAQALSLSPATVTNHLAAMRRALRAHVLSRLREATGSDDEYHAEAKRLLGGGRP